MIINKERKWGEIDLKKILAIQMPFFLKWQALHIFISSKGFSRGSVVKNPPANAGDYKRCWFDPWVGKISWRRKWRPTLVFLPGKSHGWRSLMGYSSWGHRESGTEGLNTHSRIPSPPHRHLPLGGTLVVTLDHRMKHGKSYAKDGAERWKNPVLSWLCMAAITWTHTILSYVREMNFYLKTNTIPT